jgi:hypothetical protein
MIEEVANRYNGESSVPYDYIEEVGVQGLAFPGTLRCHLWFKVPGLATS